MNYDNVSVDGKVVFFEKDHVYKLLADDDFEFTSVTTIIKKYYEEFDDTGISELVSKKKTSVYYGLDPKDIREMWRKKAEKASNEGTILHAYGEDLLNGKDVKPPLLTKARLVPLAVKEMYEDLGYELAKTELLVYSELLNLAGQADIILKKKWGDDEDYSYAVYDWKFLSKRIEKKSYYNPYTRNYKKMFGPFKHLMDCNWIHYSIQLAIYQTMTGDPVRIKEKVLVVVHDDKFEFVPCYPMRVFWDENKNLQAVYEIYNGKVYDSRIDKLLNTWPKDIKGR